MSASTISAPEQRRLLYSAGLLLALLLLSGCGPNEVQVQGSFPPPLMQKLPLRIGIWYSEEFAGHEFFDEAKGRAESGWIVRTGDAQVQMWDSLLNGMFTEFVHMKGEPGSSEMNQVVDAVLVPRVDELQYTIPAHTNIKVYEIWLRYQFDLVTSGGKPIADWTMTAYGKTPTAFLRSDAEAVNLAAVVALRDAGANFAVNFTRVPGVKEWLAEKWGAAPRAPARKARPEGPPTATPLPPTPPGDAAPPAGSGRSSAERDEEPEP